MESQVAKESKVALDQQDLRVARVPVEIPVQLDRRVTEVLWDQLERMARMVLLVNKVLEVQRDRKEVEVTRELLVKREIKARMAYKDQLVCLEILAQ